MTFTLSQSPANKKALLLASKRADCSYDVDWHLLQNHHLACLTASIFYAYLLKFSHQRTDFIPPQLTVS